MLATYLQHNKYTKKNGAISVYTSPRSRIVHHRKLTAVQVEKVEPIVISVIEQNPWSTLKDIHEKVNRKTPYQVSESFIYKYWRLGRAGPHGPPFKAGRPEAPAPMA
jgi:hypothetical protein